MYNIQITRLMTRSTLAPDNAIITKWIIDLLRQERDTAGVSVALVTRAMMADLNGRYAHKHYATNVLAFPAELAHDVQLQDPLLGDVIICPAIVNAAARRYNVPIMAHWQHIVIHGVLHLLGYDHQEAEDAELMEGREISLLASCGIPNPYDYGAVI